MDNYRRQLLEISGNTPVLYLRSGMPIKPSAKKTVNLLENPGLPYQAARRILKVHPRAKSFRFPRDPLYSWNTPDKEEMEYGMLEDVFEGRKGIGGNISGVQSR
ncbi:uncharacterized protein LOC143147422 [Ptiloglossa arizonensis]|uniref:uncharacterized protein LOC143147422 n=1 Tax=Ptiloglossa arizonensis TaxID=3350558 RepID=UPI003F9F4C09